MLNTHSIQGHNMGWGSLFSVLCFVFSFSVSVLLVYFSWSAISSPHYYFYRLATWEWWCGTYGHSSSEGRWRL